MFSITPPLTAPDFPTPAGATFQSDAIFYWLRTTKTFPFHGMYENPNPYSCTLQQTLGETSSKTSLTFDGTRSLTDLYITFNTPNKNNAPTAAPSLTISKSVNRLPAVSQEAWLLYEAKLKESNTSKKHLVFKYFIFVDCTP